MSNRAPKSPILAELRRATIDEKTAVEFFERHRWGSDTGCPRCGSTNVYQMSDRKTGVRNKDYRWRCRDCKRMYTVRTGTIFEETRLPLRHWCFAFWKACASKKGVSALQISRECEISYKSALFLMHRIRYAMAYGHMLPPARKLSGTVEVDETYVGGKPRYPGKGKRGRGTAKTPVLGIVERGGDVRFEVMDRVTAATLEHAVAEHVDTDSRLITDELNAYIRVGRHYRKHDRIKHKDRQYVRGDVHTNTVEGTFALLKRGIYGTYHSVSKKHLHRYLGEFAFRYNRRGINDDERVVAAIKRADGKRLPFRTLVDS